MRTVILTSSNIVGTGNNTLEYNFPTTATFRNDYIAVASVSLYYSWFNISQAFANNTFSYRWGTTTFGPYTIPDGLYEVSDLNDYLQTIFIDNSHYLVDKATGLNVYFGEFVINPAQYSVQINLYSVPSVVGEIPSADYTIPSGWAYPPGAGTSLGLSLGLQLGALLGYTTDQVGVFAIDITLTATSVDFSQRNTGATVIPPYIQYSVQSNTAPNIQPNSTVLISVDGVDNPYSAPTGVIYAFSPNVAVGDIIVEKPPQLCWVKLREGQFRSLRVKLLGSFSQSGLSIRDPAMTIIMAIADEQEALGFQKTK